jgi:hypothetical protein
MCQTWKKMVSKEKPDSRVNLEYGLVDSQPDVTLGTLDE